MPDHLENRVHPVSARALRCAEPQVRDATDVQQHPRSCEAPPLRSALVRHDALRRVLR